MSISGHIGDTRFGLISTILPEGFKTRSISLNTAETGHICSMNSMAQTTSKLLSANPNWEASDATRGGRAAPPVGHINNLEISVPTTLFRLRNIISRLDSPVPHPTSRIRSDGELLATTTFTNCSK